MARAPRVALIGGGIGGLTAALALTRRDFEVHVFEQAEQLSEVGAAIGIGPNAVKVMRALGLGDALETRGSEAETMIGRDLVSGQQVFCVSLKSFASRFGAPRFQIHRADLIDILARAAAGAKIHLKSRCLGISETGQSVTIKLSDGRHHEFDLLVGCDGIHSFVREVIHGCDAPRFTGHRCWRVLIPAECLPPGHDPARMTVWLGPHGHVLSYFIRDGRLMNLAAFQETADRVKESWSRVASTGELMSAFPGAHEGLVQLLECAERHQCFRWGLFDREPLPDWSHGRTTLLGDAAHPMLPFLGQGASTAIEDGYVLAGALARSPGDIAAALRSYEAERRPRTAKIQNAARTQQRFLHHFDRSAATNSEWLYLYDATVHAG